MSNHKVGKQLRMTIAGEGQPRAQGRTATAVQNLSPGYFPFVKVSSW